MAEEKAGALDKNKKYDRQLRLWGDHGQAALESAKICLINASATGTEILKNLILPGIGSFTIVDGHKIRGEDVGNNFFLDKDNIGKSRAHVATELLLELNGDVNGDFVEENPEELLDNNATFFTSFSIVIATDLPEKTLSKLASGLWEAGVPLMICRSYGMIGYMRLVVKEHTVIESHPDSSIEDLRLDRPFSGVTAYCDSLHLKTMNSKDHSHTPWLVVLYKFLMKWKAEHGGESPKNYREKNQLKEVIRQGIRRNEEGVPADEENFEEAITNVNTALVPTRIPDSLLQIFNDNACINLHAESKSFWIMARAVKDFVENEGEGTLPVRGTIPDMTSDSGRYIRLQNVYREKAAQDAVIVTRRVHQILQNLGRPQDSITEPDIRLFCKNASFLRVVRCRSLEDEINPQTAKVSDIAMHLEDPDNDDMVFYVLLRAVERFRSEYNRYPGYYDDHMEADIPKLKTCLCRILQEWGLGPAVKDDFVHEMCRYGASEPHSVAAFMGGACAQEVIKVVTSQFVPINNTFIYNAMKQTSITLEL